MIIKLHHIVVVAIVSFVALIYLANVTDKSRVHFSKSRSSSSAVATPSTSFQTLSENNFVTTNSITEFVYKAADNAPPHSLPSRIFMDWNQPSSSFCYINYKSLESLLQVYPTANITVLLPGPLVSDFYKVGSLIRWLVLLFYQLICLLLSCFH